MRAPLPPRREGGFTIAEILVVLTIIGILAAIAAPNMRDMVRIQRVKTAAFDVYSSLNLARSEAVKRNRNVIMTPTGGDWAKGWQIRDAAGTVIRDQTGWDDLTVVGPISVTFNGAGRLSANVLPFALSHAEIPAMKNRCISLDLSGRAVSKEGAC